jgi:protein-S-isoprenylcysteine O-methyltransferase Ste14
MILKLQIALTILACLFVAAVFPVATWASLGWGVTVALCALLCYGGVLLCKQKTQTDDEKDSVDENVEETAQSEDNSAEEKENLDE